MLFSGAMSERTPTTIRDFVVANRILGNEGVVDAFGHVSARHPENPERYFLACSRSPGLVTEDDIIEFDLDSNRLDGTDRAIYAERFIHGCVYKARPDIMSVCHSHAHAVVPFHPRVTTPDVSVSLISTLFGCLKTISVGPEAFALSILSTVPRITITCDKMSWRFAPTTERYFAITSWAVGNTRFG